MKCPRCGAAEPVDITDTLERALGSRRFLCACMHVWSEGAETIEIGMIHNGKRVLLGYAKTAIVYERGEDG